jgi:hypothetical protein
MVFNVSLDRPAPAAFSVDYYSYGLTAWAGSDYEAQYNTLAIPAGATSATISVPVYGDVEVEGDETFELNLFNATGGAVIADATGIGTILNDDNYVRISVADILVTEGDSGITQANFTVNLDTAASGDVSFWYYTYDVTAGAYSDYEPPFAQFVIPAGQTSATLSIPIYGDTQVEADEVFELYMYGASANAIIDNNSAFCTIVNEESPIYSYPNGRPESGFFRNGDDRCDRLSCYRRGGLPPPGQYVYLLSGRVNQIFQRQDLWRYHGRGRRNLCREALWCQQR